MNKRYAFYYLNSTERIDERQEFWSIEHARDTALNAPGEWVEGPVAGNGDSGPQDLAIFYQSLGDSVVVLREIPAPAKVEKTPADLDKEPDPYFTIVTYGPDLATTADRLNHEVSHFLKAAKAKGQYWCALGGVSVSHDSKNWDAVYIFAQAMMRDDSHRDQVREAFNRRPY